MGYFGFKVQTQAKVPNDSPVTAMLISGRLQ